MSLPPFPILAFYFFAAVLLGSALLVVFARNPVRAALALVLAFVSVSGIWLLLLAEFLAIVLVLVYVGAVLVLFLFVVMMLDINLDRIREGFARYLPVGVVVIGLVGVQMGLAIKGSSIATTDYPGTVVSKDHSNTQALGEVLFREYLYPLEIAGMLLMLAIIAAIVLTFRTRGDRLRTDPQDQIRVQAQERLRMVDVDSEPRSTESVNRDL